MNTKLKMWLTFATATAMVYFALRLLFVVLSPNTYLISKGSSYSVHKDISCPTIQTAIQVEGVELIEFPPDMKPMDVTCFHCYWRPVILYAFGIVVAIGVIVLIRRT